MLLGVKPGQNVESLGKILILGIFTAFNGLYHLKIPGNATTSQSFVIVKPAFIFSHQSSFLGAGLLNSVVNFFHRQVCNSF